MLKQTKPVVSQNHTDSSNICGQNSEYIPHVPFQVVKISLKRIKSIFLFSLLAREYGSSG